MGEMTVALGNSLFDIVEDTLPDLTEVGIDQILSDGVLREIPIVKTMYSAVKFVYNARERNLLIQTLHMIAALWNRVTDHEKIEKIPVSSAKDPRYAEKELGRILIILDQTIDEEKSRIWGILFGAFVNEEITWEMFCELT